MCWPKNPGKSWQHPVRMGDYKLLFSHKFKKDAWYNCSRHTENTNTNYSSMAQMEFYDNDDLDDDEDYDEEDDDDEDTDDDLDDEMEDDDDENYIHVDSDLKKHDAVRKFDRYGEFVQKMGTYHFVS
jgi:hypothetical protein